MNDLTLKNEIQEIIETLDTNLHDESFYVNKIFKLHVQSEIDLLKELIEIAEKRDYNNIAYYNLLYYKITVLRKN